MWEVKSTNCIYLFLMWKVKSTNCTKSLILDYFVQPKHRLVTIANTVFDKHLREKCSDFRIGYFKGIQIRMTSEFAQVPECPNRFKNAGKFARSVCWVVYSSRPIGIPGK